MNDETIIDVLRSVNTSLATFNDQTRRLRQAIIRVGSATDDNRACAERVDIGEAEILGVGMHAGARINGVLLSDIMDALESCPLPEALHEDLPALTPDDWRAFMRLLMLITTELQHPRESDRVRDPVRR